MPVDRRELAYQALAALLGAGNYFRYTARNQEIELDQCEHFPFAVLFDGGEQTEALETGRLTNATSFQVQVGVETTDIATVETALNGARAKARNLMAAWISASPPSGDTIQSIEYLGCSAPELPASGASRGAMTLLFVATYHEAEADAYAAG